MNAPSQTLRLSAATICAILGLTSATAQWSTNGTLSTGNTVTVSVPLKNYVISGDLVFPNFLFTTLYRPDGTLAAQTKVWYPTPAAAMNATAAVTFKLDRAGKWMAGLGSGSPNSADTFTFGATPALPPPPDAVTFTIAPTTFTYTGASQGPTISGFSNYGYTLTPANWMLMPSSDPTSAVAANSYNISLQATGINPVGSPYTGSSAVRWTIDPATVSYSLSPMSFTYDGSGKSTSVVVSGNTVGLSWNTSGTLSATNAGAYPVMVSTTDANHSGSNALAWVINKADQTISFGNPGAQTFGGAATVTAAASSGLPVSFAVTSGPGSLSGNTLTFTGVGSVTVTTSQPGDSNWNAAPSVRQTFNVQPKPVTFTNAPALFTYDGNPKTTAVSASDAATTFTTGGTLTATNSGSYTATAVANGNFSGANNNLGWTIQKGTQDAVTSGGGSVSYGDAFTANVAGGSGTGSYTFQLEAGGTAPGGSVSAIGSVSAAGTGTVLFRAMRQGDSNWNASAWSPTYAVTFSPRPVIVTLTGGKEYDGTTDPIGASAALSAGSLADGDVVEFHFAPTASANADSYPSLTAATVSNAGIDRSVCYQFTFVGTYVIRSKPITFSLDQNSFVYSGSPQGPRIIASDPAASFTTSGTLSATDPNSYTATATASGNYVGENQALHWTIEPAAQAVDLSPPSPATVVGRSVTLTAAGGRNGYVWGGVASGGEPAKSLTFPATGAYVVTVFSPAGGGYLQSNTVSTTITVSKADQTISFAQPEDVIFGQTVRLAAAASSGLPVSLAVTAGPAALAGNTLNFSGVGEVTVRAAQPGDAAFAAAPVTEHTFRVLRAPATFSLNQTRFVYSGTAQQPNISVSPAGATFVTGGTTSAMDAGEYAATAVATGNYVGVSESLRWAIEPAGQVITLSPEVVSTSVGAPATFTASGGGGTGAWTWGGTAGALGTAASCNVSAPLPGSYSVTVYHAADANYHASNLAVATLTVTNTAPHTSLAASSPQISLGDSVILTVTSTDSDANLLAQAVDYSQDQTNWVSGWSNWAGPTAWQISGATDTRSVTFTPSAVGTWYFRAHGADTAAATSDTLPISLNVTSRVSIQVMPQRPAVVVQDSENTNHAQIRVP